MRAGLSTIQQTLTPEAGAVLNHSIAEAGRRNHGQTTPLHVAATLLASPSGFLRQACIRSHPNSSHPLQCRALELCFSVALERLPTSQNMEPGSEPPISNALMAALKRAQAHQRKGCPEQQQQPLLAVKVELEQLIISILDDPSVSRVMREASFSSPAVKATIEQSLNTNPHPHPNPLHLHLPHSNGHVNLGSSFGGVIGSSRMLMNPQSALAPTCVSPVPNRNMFINPKLRQAVSGPSGNQRTDELKKILDILMRSKKKNPVLVGDSEPESVVKELIRKINHGELGTNSPLNNIQVISIFKELNSDKNHLIMKIKQLADLVENRVKDYASILIDLGDLKWVVEPTASNSGGMQQQQQNSVSDAGKEAVMEMGKLLTKLTEMNNACKVWLIGTATCETYLRCQVYHPTMENDWDLQAVPIAARSPLPGMLPRFGNERITSNSIEPLIPLKSFQTMVPSLTKPSFENPDLSQKLSGFQPSIEKNEHGSNITTKDIESSSVENKSEPSRSSLPQWLQNAKLHNGESNKATDDQSQNKDQAFLLKQNAPEMQKKWSDACLNLHNLNRNVVSEKIGSPMSLYNPKLFLHQPTQPRLMTTYGKTLQLNPNIPSQQAGTPPGSPVRTDLILGRQDSEKICQEETVKDFLGGISTEQPQMKLTEKFANALDAASFKKLLKGLMDCAWWQPEAASMVASAVTRCQLGNGKQRSSGTKGDIWLLFTGPDRIGKRKMGSVLSEQMCGFGLVIISLGSKRDDKELDTNTNIRGRTALDRIVESVRRNPFAVIMLEDIDEADFLLRGNIKRAMEKGRLTDTHGREISLGNVIFILTGNWSTFEDNHHLLDENKLADAVNGDWNLKLTIGQKSSNSKRRAHWLSDSDRPIKQRIEPISGLSFDLNQSVGLVDDRNDGSYNSSDLTVDHDEEHGHETRQFAITSVPQELVNFADEAIAFKPVDFAFVRREIKKTLSVKLSMVIDNNLSIQIEDNALEKIIGGLLHGRCNLTEWVDKALTPGFEILKGHLPLSPESPVVHLRLHQNAGTDDRSNGDWLPSKVAVMVDEAMSV